MPVEVIAEESRGRAFASRPKIPRQIKRNTLMLALTQALVGSGVQLLPTLGPIMVVQMLGSMSLSGIATSISGITRFLAAYPIGKIMDAYGRKAGIVIGLLLGTVGAALSGWAALLGSFPLLLAALLVFGLGLGATGQLRLAAADMYPANRRAEGIGWVLTGSIVGAFGGPLIVTVATLVAPNLGGSPVALAWFLVPAVSVPSLVLVMFIHPDPKVIAANLDRYYPGQVAQPVSAPAQGDFDVRYFLRDYPKLVVFVSCFAAHGNMTMLMAITSVALAHYGHALPAISASVGLHAIGMFGLSLPLGALCDRLGRRPLMLAGTIVTIIGSVLVPLTPVYAVITTGTFLVGVGWSCINVAATAVIADTTAPSERGRAIGANDSISSVAGIVMPLLGGVLAEALGLGVVGLTGVLLMLPPLALLLNLKEPRPGRYQHAVNRKDVGPQ